jgi:hypothetical protein
MIAFFLTPIGRYVGVAIIVVLALTGVYYKIRTDAVNSYINKENTQSLERVDEAIKAGDAVDRADANPSRLRDPDSFERK